MNDRFRPPCNRFPHGRVTNGTQPRFVTFGSFGVAGGEKALGQSVIAQEQVKFAGIEPDAAALATVVQFDVLVLQGEENLFACRTVHERHSSRMILDSQYGKVPASPVTGQVRTERPFPGRE